MKLTDKFIQQEIDNGNTFLIPKVKSNKVVVFSDWHLGTGGNNDDSLKNCLYLYEALKYYDENDYYVVLLGDTFELAEKNKLEDIKNIHEDLMEVLSDIFYKGNLLFIRGNHDAYLKEVEVMYRTSSYTKTKVPLFPTIKFYDSAKLETKETYFMMHGHQYSRKYKYFNKLICWVIRNIYSPLELYLLKDPTGELAAFEDSSGPTELFSSVAARNNVNIICGHMHTISMDHPKYYNVGSGVLPRCITCGEIINGEFFMYKWSTVVEDEVMKVKKSLIN